MLGRLFGRSHASLQLTTLPLFDTFTDTIRTVEGYADCIVLRHFQVFVLSCHTARGMQAVFPPTSPDAPSCSLI
jgi:hypothetical protein